MSSGELGVITLGRFAVLRDGVELPHGAWQSRQARMLLKLLVCHPGWLPREVAAATLWPTYGGPAGSRFSVVLSTLRKVLDPDHHHPADHFVATTDGAVHLTEHVSVDATLFLVLVRAGRLDAAEPLYGGDFLEEDQYADWALARREEVRAAALSLLRQLARTERSAAARDRAAADRATAHLHRLLVIDPYDEEAWLDLIDLESARRHHGEARRLHATYSLRMLDIGVPAVPFPDLAVPQPRRPLAPSPASG